MRDLAVTLNAEPILVAAVHPSPLIGTAERQRRLGPTTAFDLITTLAIGRCEPSSTCAVT